MAQPQASKSSSQQQQQQQQWRQQQWRQHCSQADLDAVRLQARRLWSEAAGAADNAAACCPTGCSSYRSHYGRPKGSCSSGIIGSEQQLKQRQQGKPASPHRRNKPHPSQLFLTCRLHFVPDYNCTDCKAVNEPVETGETAPSISESMSVVSTADDKSASGDANGSPVDSKQNLVAMMQNATGRFRAKKGSASGAGDRNGHGHHHHHHHHHHHRDPHPGGLVFQPTRIRGDFLIHPSWPPTLPHHQVP